MPTARLEPAIPEDNRPQTCALDRAATGTSSFTHSHAHSKRKSWLIRQLNSYFEGLLITLVFNMRCEVLITIFAT